MGKGLVGERRKSAVKIHRQGAGLQNCSLIPSAIQAIPGIGNMMLRYGPQINQYGVGFISGYMPSGPSTFRNIKEAGSWLLGNWLGP